MSSNLSFFGRLGSEIKKGLGRAQNAISGKQSRKMAEDARVREAERAEQALIQSRIGKHQFKKRTRPESRADQQYSGASGSYLKDVWGTNQEEEEEKKHEELYQRFKELERRRDSLDEEEEKEYFKLANYPYSMASYGGGRRRSKTKRSKKSARKSKRKTRR